jgi:hypothetical protein
MTDRLRSSVEKYRGISSYTQRQAKSALDTMPDDEIVELAHDLIYATAEWTPCVGATPIQTATIKPGEQATIDQPPFPRSGMFLPSDGTWHHGVKFTSDYPFDERRTGVVYTSCLINENRRPIPLGDNYFYGNEFIGAIFQYSGGGIFFGENNRAQHCTLLVTNGVDSSKLETITWAFTEVKIIP